MVAHRQLHVERGALYNCAQCVFNVTRSDVLYHHYRTGHGVEEPELRYPEDSVVRAGHKAMVAKNQSKEQRPDDKQQPAADAQDAAAGGPPLVWNYRRQNEPPFTKVFKCRYCPHTNRRRHNTVEHERMHSDHPEHLVHRQQQQRSSGAAGSPTPSPMHPCKRCTYVCNNAGVLASHVKVHSVGFGTGTVGFYDTEIVDTMQILALEYAMDLERQLLLDDGERLRSAQLGSAADDAAAATGHPRDGCNKYSELDEPELKFCPRCPDRFFFLSDLRCHARFHELKSGRHACDLCSFATRTADHLESHKTVHGDEYARRTAELITAYRVSEQYPRPTEYPAVKPGCRVCGSPPVRSPVYEIVETSAAADDDSEQRQPAETKRPHSETDVATTHPEQQPEACSEEPDAKRRRRSTSSVEESVETTADTVAASVPPPLIALPVQTGDPLVTPRVLGAANVQTPIAPKAGGGATVKNAGKDGTAAVKTTAVRQFKCDKCPGRFFKATALQYHGTLHGGSGVHRCRECDYAVSMYGNLIRHEAVHRDLPPRDKTKTSSNPAARVKCAPAAAAAADHAEFVSSSPTVGGGSPAKREDDAPPAVENAAAEPRDGPPFFYPTTVKNGVARPKRYRCPKCPSAFDKRSQYTVHITLHGAGDKYQCDKCDYSVRYTANYVQHQRKHARDAELRRSHERGGASALGPDDAQPRDTVFRNEISDRQTAYELNAAYGATELQTSKGGGGGGGGEDPLSSSFRCEHCPFECGDRDLLEQHAVHHRKEDPDGGGSAWKRSCRFCTYRAQSDADMTEHTRGHFYRSTSAVLSSFAVRTKGGRAAVVGPTDHVEFHGKRVQINGRGKGAADDGEGDDADIGDEPFFVFRDRGDGDAGEERRVQQNGDARRFSPDSRTPPVLIDFNDNRTSGDYGEAAADGALSEKSLMRLQQPAMVRYVNGRKRLEFLNGGPKSGDKKKKKSKKH